MYQIYLLTRWWRSSSRHTTIY